MNDQKNFINEASRLTGLSTECLRALYENKDRLKDDPEYKLFIKVLNNLTINYTSERGLIC